MSAGSGEAPKPPCQQGQHREVDELRHAVPHVKLPLGVLDDLRLVGCRLNHWWLAFALQLELVLLLVPNGELGSDEFAADQCEAKQHPDDRNGPPRESAPAVQPLE